MKDSNSTEKGKCKVKYTINKIKLQQMSGTEFNTKKNIAILSVIEQMVETRAQKEGRGLTKNSADCVRNNERHCNIFWLDAKC